ncbi:hypothetical protein AN964_09670 [Heyndrickxia shackletonii]|uniref:UPF0398 protein AN964_09670 n=1 Tax=Heyndrickxia shackletonii TaxID=157838 RepID=A0A0Q3WX09_9BACI|nr:DUF1273 domain-containing protein [Heyndrickxia shackletonii]KQL53743.1 hypothetical protein AN964_09670 [Heyndrickxia shackletonii]NEY99887.1 DUF1273 domain-containing protein [Heyndrickxia shackletonii]
MVKVLCITGYKPFELGIFSTNHPAIKYIKMLLKREIIRFLEDELEWVLISGQLGVELWAAEVVFDLQMEYPDLKLAILTPFLNQEEKWNDNNKEMYEMILAQADFVDSISKQPYQNPQAFKNKNKIFLHKTDGLLIVYDEQNIGSPKYLLEEAEKYKSGKSYEIRTIDFNDLQSIMEEEQWNES